MTMKYFRLTDDVHYPERWHLGEIEEIDNWALVSTTLPLETSGTFSGRGVEPTRSSGTGPIVGLGARLKFMEAFSARLEFERYFHIGDAARTGRSNIDFGSVGLQHRF